MTAVSDETTGAYSPEHAEIYDFVHAARGRDWAAEAEDYHRLIRRWRPDAASLLDVACGTGAHLASFVEHFDRAEGLELSAGMREMAGQRLPGVPVHAGDLREFDLGRTYDAVVCLCFSVAFSHSVAELRSAVAAMARHLTPGGVLVIEPWWFPERFLDGFVSAALAEAEGRAVSRISHSVRVGDHSRMTVRYTVADRAGIRDFTSVETLSLFTEEQYTDAFAAAGCSVEYQPGGPNGRGLFVGVRR
ncbi:class I SAM-dependent methyltransferase [Streptomyces sp. DSM 44915]|uniref:Class I SAM-dependent methyltransferase n=1 Tax=Streptomyces chisholmiae TaxID=3075540 RepID=A0ABU2K0P4_9ACTN|nr:class I SAM-dependent methyltransferase [Streptomyces sp. DSM 44915]MDT0270822.1 class I SAM-dependent methyltransferase [Streptomyces sp. DSM 44915]